MVDKKRPHWRTIIGSIIVVSGIAMKMNKITEPMSDATIGFGTLLLGYGLGNWRGNEGKL